MSIVALDSTANEYGIRDDRVCFATIVGERTAGRLVHIGESETGVRNRAMYSVGMHHKIRDLASSEVVHPAIGVRL